MAKKALRAKMKVVLFNMSKESKSAQSAAVTAKLLQLPSYQTARSVALFLSMEDEVNTDMILDDIIHSGKKCFIPKYVSQLVSSPFLFYVDQVLHEQQQDGDGEAEGQAGLHRPSPHQVEYKAACR